MNPEHKKFVKSFAAAAFAFPFFASLEKTFLTASLLGAAALFVTYLFILLQPLFPEKLFRVSVLLFVAVLFQSVTLALQATCVWVVSLLLLLDWNDFSPKHLGNRPLPPLVRVGVFWSCCMAAGMVREFLGPRLEIFRQPAGLFFTLAVLSVLITRSEKLLAPLWMKKRTA